MSKFFLLQEKTFWVRRRISIITMFKKKDHAMLEEAYAKVMMNEITMGDGPEDEGRDEHEDLDLSGDERKWLNLLHSLNDAINDQQYHNAKEIMKSFLHAENSLEDEEEPQSTGGNEGTGRYISNKQKSAEHKTDFYINRMNMKPGEDF